MSVLGALPGDIEKCLCSVSSSGCSDIPTVEKHEACKRVIFGFYIWPHFQKMLEKEGFLGAPTLPLPPPVNLNPYPQPSIVFELGAILLGTAFGESNLKPNEHLDMRIKTTEKFIDGLSDVTKELEEQVKFLKSQM